jgi:acyl-CoA thioester hydrolase
VRHATSPAKSYETKLRVRYAETDQMGVVYHSNYIVWFEVGRVEMLRQLGFTYREMEREDDTHIAVVEANCRFKAPAHYDDLILVRTRLLNVRESLLHFGYEVVRESDGRLLAEGETVHLVVDREFKR